MDRKGSMESVVLHDPISAMINVQQVFYTWNTNTTLSNCSYLIRAANPDITKDAKVNIQTITETNIQFDPKICTHIYKICIGTSQQIGYKKYIYISIQNRLLQWINLCVCLSDSGHWT